MRDNYEPSDADGEDLFRDYQAEQRDAAEVARRLKQGRNDMGKQTSIEKAIASLEGEITVLQLAVTKLKQQQQPKRPAKPRAVQAPDKQAG